MAQTKQGAFDETYIHIEAPTIVDEEYWHETKKRKLCVPEYNLGDSKIFRSPTLYYLSSANWRPRRKIDGENIRIKWDGEQALWNGKTNAFNCSANFTEYMNNTFIEEIFEEKFGRDKTVILYGEHVGKKVQKNDLGLDKDEVVLFDVQINGIWLDYDNVKEIAQYFNIRHHSDFESPLDEEDLVTIIREVGAGEFKNWEGIVATPAVEMLDKTGKRIIVKIKNKDYLR